MSGMDGRNGDAGESGHAPQRSLDYSQPSSSSGARYSPTGDLATMPRTPDGMGDGIDSDSDTISTSTSTSSLDSFSDLRSDIDVVMGMLLENGGRDAEQGGANDGEGNANRDNSVEENAGNPNDLRLVRMARFLEDRRFRTRLPGFLRGGLMRSRFWSVDNIQVEQESEDDSSTEQHEFDTAVPTRHTYLGEVDDLEGGFGTLEEGTQCVLPLIAHPHVVLFPGATLPLRITNPRDQASIERALDAEPPLKRLIAVVNLHIIGNLHLSTVGCTAEIRQLGRKDGVVSVVAKGRQRIEIDTERLLQESDLAYECAHVTVLPDPPAHRVPRDILNGEAYAPAWATKPFDAFHLASRAHKAAETIIPEVKDLQDDPVRFSYWLAANLPLEDDTRQKLLEKPTVADRLKAELKVMKQLATLYCNSCGGQIAGVGDIIVMSEEGTSGVFVNSNGHVHDMITLKQVQNLKLWGEAETVHTWFPGYAWTIAECRNCGEHIGWRYSATERGLKPSSFWGLRRCQLTYRQG